MSKWSPRFAVPTATILVLLAAAGVDAQQPIPAGPDAPIRSRYLEKLYAEELRVVDEYDKHTKDPVELREAAHRLLASATRDEWGMPGALSREEAYRLGAELMANGSKDPLVVAITMNTAPNLDKKDDIKAHCEQAINDVVQTYSPRQQIDVITRCQRVQLALYYRYRRERTKFGRPNHDLLDDAYVRWVSANTDDLQRQRWMWEVIERYYLDPMVNRGFLLLEVTKKLRDKKVHPWMRLMLEAYATANEANTLWMNSKTQDNGYMALYRKEAKQFEEAWRLAPQFPEAATALVQLARGGHTDGTPRQWFDRAIAAEIDHPMAYTYYRTHLRSEGSDALIRFGEECAATGRYDTTVPYELIECYWAVENQTGENVWARDGVYGNVRDYFQDAMQAPHYRDELQSDDTRAWLAAQQIVLAARANRYEDIAALWKTTNDEKLRQAANWFSLKTPLPELKAKADAAAEGIATLVNDVEEALAAVADEKSALAAQEKIAAAAAKMKPDDLRVSQWQAALDFYRDFYADKWADVRFPYGLTKLADAPKWYRVNERTVLTRGTYRFRIPYLTRLPAPFEVRFDVNTIQMPPDVEIAGVQLGPEQVPNWRTKGNLFGINSQTQKAAIRFGDYTYFKASFAETNRLQIRAWRGFREFFVNDERMTQWFNYAFSPAGEFMLWAPGPDESTPIVRFSNLQIRRILHGPPPEQAEFAARVEYYTERINQDPEYVWNYLDRGNAFLSSGQPLDALSDYEHVLKQRPNWPFAILRIGMARAANGEYAKAIERYEQVLKLAPDAAHALEQLAWLEATCPQADLRNGEKALERMTAALKLTRNVLGEYSLTLAAVHAELGDFEAAQGDLKQAEPFVNRHKYKKPLEEAMQQAFDEKKPFRDTERLGVR